MTTLTPTADGVEESTIARMQIKEEVEGISVQITVNKSAITGPNGEENMTMSVDTESEECKEFLKPFHDSIKSWGRPFEEMVINAVWLDPNPLGVAPFMVEEVVCTNDAGNKGTLFFETLQNLCMSVGWMAPLLHPMPTAMLKSLLDDDEEACADMRSRIAKMPSLIRETTYTPKFSAVLMPYTEEEMGLKWDIS